MNFSKALSEVVTGSYPLPLSLLDIFKSFIQVLSNNNLFRSFAKAYLKNLEYNLYSFGLNKFIILYFVNLLLQLL